MRLAALFVAVSLYAAPVADSPLLQKFNSCADAMNQVRDELQQDVANRKHMMAATAACDRLYNDDGWLR